MIRSVRWLVLMGTLLFFATFNPSSLWPLYSVLCCGPNLGGGRGAAAGLFYASLPQSQEGQTEGCGSQSNPSCCGWRPCVESVSPQDGLNLQQPFSREGEGCFVLSVCSCCPYHLVSPSGPTFVIPSRQGRCACEHSYAFLA